MKRIIAMLLLVLMAFGLVACGGANLEYQTEYGIPTGIYPCLCASSVISYFGTTRR